MKLSWSHKLYLRINQHVGERPWLDFIMLYTAHWVVYILVGGIVAYAFVFVPNLRQFFAIASLSYFFAYLVSYTIAMVWKHERPVKEFPNVKQLFHTWGTWKSFPSDHSIAA